MDEQPELFRTETEQYLDALGLCFEISIVEHIFAKKPNDPDIMAALAELYTKSGQLESGLELDRKLVEKDWDNPITHYNLACSYALLDMKLESLEELETAIRLGYSDADHMINDSDLDNIKSVPRFQELLKNITS